MTEIASKPDHGDTLIRDGAAVKIFQDYLDEITEAFNANLLGNQVTLPSYTVLALPAVTSFPGMIFVSDEAGGAVPAFSSGGNWLRVTDREIVS